MDAHLNISLIYGLEDMKDINVRLPANIRPSR